MSKRTKSYKDFLDGTLRDPEEAVAYLREAIDQVRKGEDLELFFLALRDVVRANGVSKVAKKTSKSRPSLYKSLSKNGDPKFSTVLDILNSLNVRLDFRSDGEKKAA